MQVIPFQSLAPYTTFGIDENAEHFVTVNTLDELLACCVLCQEEKMPLHILGGGSNILLTNSLKGLTVHNCLKGIEVMNENETHVNIKFASGEIWHQCVLWSVKHNYGGIENMSLIPGTIGAAPIQNIGAYGVELKDVFVELEALHLHNLTTHKFTLKQCEFGYRDSIFKQKEKGNYFILSVTLRLSKQPVCNIHYGQITDELAKLPKTEYTIQDVSNAVISIRQAKLPDPAQIGNAGSFFKNPVIDKMHFQQLKLNYPSIPGYPGGDFVKVPAGWLIEHCGPSEHESWKGYTDNEVGVHKHQALVLVNYGQAKGDMIFNLSERIISSVQEKFAIQLEREVNIW